MNWLKSKRVKSIGDETTVRLGIDKCVVEVAGTIIAETTGVDSKYDTGDWAFERKHQECMQWYGYPQMIRMSPWGDRMITVSQNEIVEGSGVSIILWENKMQWRNRRNLFTPTDMRRSVVLRNWKAMTFDRLMEVLTT